MAILATYRTKIDGGAVRVLQTVTRSHMNMPALHSHPKWSGLSNSDMMPGIMATLFKRASPNGRTFQLDALPACITVTPDKSGFMATVQIEG